MPVGGEAALGGGELRLLQLDVGAHLPLAVVRGELEHAVVQRVEAGQGDELKGVAHRGQLPLERGDLVVVEVLLPVEAGRAVVGELLLGEVAVDPLGEGAGQLEVRLGGLDPQQVDRKSTRLNSSHVSISYAVFCLSKQLS